MKNNFLDKVLKISSDEEVKNFVSKGLSLLEDFNSIINKYSRKTTKSNKAKLKEVKK